MFKFWFEGKRGVGTWPLIAMAIAADEDDARQQLRRQGWHGLRLLSKAEIVLSSMLAK